MKSNLKSCQPTEKQNPAQNGLSRPRGVMIIRPVPDPCEWSPTGSMYPNRSWTAAASAARRRFDLEPRFPNHPKMLSSPAPKPYRTKSKTRRKMPIFQVEPSATEREIIRSERRFIRKDELLLPIISRVPISDLPFRTLPSPIPTFVNFSPAQVPVNQRP